MKFKKLLILASSIVTLGHMSVGCSDPTAPNQKIIDQMNQQRSGQQNAQKTGREPRPGSNPYTGGAAGAATGGSH